MAVNYCLTIIYNPKHDKVLTQFHENRGMNFPGGHVEQNEAPIEAAYRELFEETGITRDYVDLKEVNILSAVDKPRHQDMIIYVYHGTLKKKNTLIPEGNDILNWTSIKPSKNWLYSGRDFDGLAWTLLQWSIQQGGTT